MAVKKQKWEIEFEKYKLMGLDKKKVEDLDREWSEQSADYAKKLAQIKDTSSEEYRKLVGERKAAQRSNEKLKRIVTNMPKIERLKALRDAAQVGLEDLLKQKEESKKIVEKRKSLEKEIQKLEDELKKLKEKEEELNKILSSSESSEKQKQDARVELAENRKRQSKNQFDFSDKQLQLDAENKKEVIEISDKKIEAGRTEINKCNFACRMLIEGKSMDEVQVSLAQWKDKRLTKKPEAKAPETPAPEKKVPVPETPAPEAGKPKAEETPVPVSDFAKKHPRLAAVGNWFKTQWGNIKNKFTKKGKEGPKKAPGDLDEKDLEGIEEIVEEAKKPEKPENPFKSTYIVTPEMTKGQSADEMNARKAEYYRRWADKGTFRTTVEEDLQKQGSNDDAR